MADLPLGRSVYDRAALRRDDAAWLEQSWPGARVVTVTSRSATPATRTPDGEVHLAMRAAGDVPSAAPRRFLGIADDQPYFAVTIDADGTLEADVTSDGDAGGTGERVEWLTLRDIGAGAGDLDAGLLACAIALEQWHQRHPCCPRCGAPTVEAKAGWTRVCTAEGSEHFPRTDPAVIMLIHDGGDLALLGRGHDWGAGRFSTLAGFVEPGESLEAAVAREVFEETGVGVRDIRYVASQPWPFPASLMLGFTAVLDGDPTVHIDPVEMAEAAWFTRAEVAAARDWTDEHTPGEPGRRLLAIPPRLSISRYLIDGWLEA